MIAGTPRAGARRFTDDELRQARAVELVGLIGRAVKLAKRGRLHVGCCPFHVEKSGSFTLFEDNHFHCYGCGAHGDPIAFTMRHGNKSFPDAVEDLLGGRGPGARAVLDPEIARRLEAEEQRRVEAERQETLRKLESDWRRWERARVCRPGDMVWRYLHGRACLVTPFPEVLRLDDRMWHPDFFDLGKPTRFFTVMLARVDNRAGEFTGLHATYLVEAGGGKVTQDPELKARGTAKITHGALMGGAIRLFPEPGDGRLGIDEGIENALSSHIMSQSQVWAAPDHTKLGGFDIPAWCTGLDIYSQRDPAQTAPGKIYAPEGIGMRSARKLQQRCRERGIEHRVLLPRDGHKDSNLALLARIDGRNGLRAGSVEAVTAP